VSQLEIPLTAAIRRELTRMSVWWIATGVSVKRKATGVRSGEPGMPDTLLPALGWLETKTLTGELSASQVAWHARALREGVRVAVVRSVAEAVAAVRGWRESGL
jgi:hypothetical protein